MSEKAYRHASKFLSLILRHNPAAVGLSLDQNGWVDVEELLAGMQAAGTRLTRTDLERIVAEDSKGRYALEGERIRANQGHSINVDLELIPVTPPGELFHGTATRFLASILTEGLHAQSRQHVHLSSDRATAVNVGKRHGKICVLNVAAERMHEDGFTFFQSANGVWLTEHVPTRYLAEEVPVHHSAVR